MRHLISNAMIVNENRIYKGNILINGNFIEDIFEFDIPEGLIVEKETDAAGKLLIPGVCDTHVHFREPGLTDKADIFSESRAAIAGGVTSFFEMPNTVPPTLDLAEIDKKIKIAEEHSVANFAFYIGVSKTNIEEIMNIDSGKICAIKLFMGNSTGNMGVSNNNVLEKIFAQKSLPVVVHCEDNSTVKTNENKAKAEYGTEILPVKHIDIRSVEACYISTKYAVETAKKHGTRLHVAHLSTENELELFEDKEITANKQITCEVSIHHLWFNEKDYEKYGNYIKCNPSIKEERHRKALFEGLKSGLIDSIASDHAPHLKEEKQRTYFDAPSGIPMIQFGLQMMLEKYLEGEISIEKIVEKMCHNPNILFKTKKRGFIRKGYYADLVLIDLKSGQTVKEQDILYKCGWSPMLNYKFKSKITHTFVNGNLTYENGKINDKHKGKLVEFER